MKKIVSVVGVRPEFIKLAGINAQLDANFNHLILHTGQHYDREMSINFFREFSLRQPDLILSHIRKEEQEIISSMFRGCYRYLKEQKPYLVFVYGDTNSTLAGGLAGMKLNIKVVHVEAGLRSFDREMPEEKIRIVVDHLSDVFFCPSQEAVRNLNNEGIKKNIFFTGDVSYSLFKKINTLKTSVLSKYNVQKGKYYFCTILRAENTNSPARFREILASINRLDKKVVFSVHPREKYILVNRRNFDNIIFVNPLSYTNSLSLQKNSRAVITDSGSMQREAYWLKVPCFTVRSSTEWVETLEDGWNRLIDSREMRKIPEYLASFNRPSHPLLYQIKNTGSKIVKILQDRL